MVKLKEIEAADDAGDLYRLQTEWWRDRGLSRPELIGALPKIMRYIERLEEQVKLITWTSTKPTTPGWYWRRTAKKRDTHIVYAYRKLSKIMVTFMFVAGRKTSINVERLHGEWSSEPIPEPQEDTSCGTSSFSAPASSPTKS